MPMKLYFATNRNHVGDDRWHPKAYGTTFSRDGLENLRLGVVEVSADEDRISAFLAKPMDKCGQGDGDGLGQYLAQRVVDSSRITPFPEVLDGSIAESGQRGVQLGSQAMFAELMEVMKDCSDVLVFIHGFNVSWAAAVGSALALQTMLNRDRKEKTVTVVLFTWPSDGLALPWVSYKSDRAEAAGSGGAVGRSFLKLRDFLAGLHDRARTGGVELCGQEIHLLCHSMGNYVLQNALAKAWDHHSGNTLPRLFEHIFLCAPDVDDICLEADQPLARIDQLARNVTIYHNRNDKALVISDFTKGNPERLGGNGAAHPILLHQKIHQVDCTPVVDDFIGHGYFLIGNVNADIRLSIDSVPQDGNRRRRQAGALGNLWVMTE